MSERIYILKFTVTEQHLDENNHVNNVKYVEWMQDVAVGHTNAMGWTSQRYHALGCSWFARSHYINYRRQANLGDHITIKTWIEDLKRASSVRKYTFENQHDEIIADAETHWAFVNIVTGRPMAVLDEVRTDFAKICAPTENQ